ncbi:hypothetical protein FPANT_10905 [Fusarium pseudoanthophilum]|uniref:Uncharacterized protein n=1 Tax=Fusarium pseudoanthophilum TaxID=48495 RepID=A0A8H5KNG8_9HYPO|nr:hypothetical protein FPANT_10905 [Fusarium pseudoanthophilum]
MATTQRTEFPSLSDSRLPSSELDKRILVQLKGVWDEHSDTWDEETKRELVDHILKGYTKVTRSNQTYPSCHRLWKADHPTFARWVVLRVTYDEDKLSTPREWLRHKYENFDPQSWASPVSKKLLKAQGTRCESGSSSEEDLGTLWKSQEPKSLRSADAMEICDNESDYDKIHGDGTYKDDRLDNSDQDETNSQDKAITRSRFKAVNVPEPGQDLSRKRGTSNASVNPRTKLQKTDSLRTPSSTEEVHLPEASSQSTAHTADIQAHSRPLQWKAKLQELRLPVRGMHQSQPALNLGASAGVQAYLSPNPTVVSFTQSSDDQNDFRSSTTPRQWAISQERASRIGAPLVSYEKVDVDPRDRILYRGHSTQSGHVRANFGLADHRSGDSGASTQRLPWSLECRDNTSTMAPQGPFDSSLFSSSSHAKEQPRTGEPLPLRLTHRETLESPGNVSTQQPSGLQQLPLDDPHEPSWFRQFRTQYYSDQEKTRKQIAYEIKREVTGIVFHAVQDLIQPLSNSITQCVDSLAKHNTNAVGVTEHIDQAVSAAQDLRDMKQILDNIVDTSRLQLETSQREGAAIQGRLLPVITEHRKDIDNLAQRATSIEERTADVEEYLELQLADEGGHSARNAPQRNENEHHTFGNHEGTRGY